MQQESITFPFLRHHTKQRYKNIHHGSERIRKQSDTYNLEEARHVSTPCDENFNHLEKNPGNLLTTHHSYCALIGALLWLSNGTRPDITFAVNWLSSFMNNPTDTHWKAEVCVLVYARNTANFSITLGGQDKTLTAHLDSGWAKCYEDCHSTTGFIFFFGKSPVSWKSKRQPNIALSLTEAEYMALTNTTCEALWWRTVLHDFDYINLTQPTTINYDNKGAGDLAPNPCHHARSKHIDVKHHFIHECISNNTISLNQVQTTQILAGIFTKPLKKTKHLLNVGLFNSLRIEGGCWNDTIHISAWYSLIGIQTIDSY